MVVKLPLDICYHEKKPESFSYDNKIRYLDGGICKRKTEGFFRE